MWSVADRVLKTFSDVTVGTVIVLVHVAMVDREPKRTPPVTSSRARTRA